MTSPAGDGRPSPLCIKSDGTADGWQADDRCMGTYIHGILDNGAFVDRLLEPYAEKTAQKHGEDDWVKFKESQYDLLADHIRRHVDMNKIRDAKWVHVSGFTMSTNQNSAEAVYKMVREVSEETKVCFDPNIRPEALSVEQIKALCQPVLERADIIFPSKGEAMMFTGAATDDEGCKQWASEGRIVVLKNGDAGCRIFSGDEVIDVPSFQVEEVDPTGAGDTFCGAVCVSLSENATLSEAVEFATAAASITVQRMGAQSSIPTRNEINEITH